MVCCILVYSPFVFAILISGCVQEEPTYTRLVEMITFGIADGSNSAFLWL